MTGGFPRPPTGRQSGGGRKHAQFSPRDALGFRLPSGRHPVPPRGLRRQAACDRTLSGRWPDAGPYAPCRCRRCGSGRRDPPRHDRGLRAEEESGLFAGSTGGSRVLAPASRSLSAKRHVGPVREPRRAPPGLRAPERSAETPQAIRLSKVPHSKRRRPALSRHSSQGAAPGRASASGACGTSAETELLLRHSCRSATDFRKETARHQATFRVFHRRTVKLRSSSIRSGSVPL